MNEIPSKVLNDTYFVYGVENSGIKTILVLSHVE